MAEEDIGRQRLLLAKVWADQVKNFLERWDEKTLAELIYSTGKWFKGDSRRDAHLAVLYEFQRSPSREFETADGKPVVLELNPMKSPRYREAWARDLFASAAERFESLHEIVSELSFLTAGGNQPPDSTNPRDLWKEFFET